MATKRKKFHVTPVGSPNSDINVTPMVDVVLVLLIIFMVVTPLLEKDIEVRVPDTEEVETTAEVPQDQLVVAIDGQGTIRINDTPVTAAAYLDHMKKLMQTRKDKLAFFMADDKANYGLLVSVLDQTRLAGAETLGMMTTVPENLVPGGMLPPPPPGSPPPGLPPGPPPPGPPPPAP